MTVDELFRIQILHGFIFQILAAECLFAPVLKRRNRFVVRSVGGFVVYAFTSFLVINVLTRFLPGFSSMAVFFISILLFYFCFDEKFSTVVFCCTGAQLVQNLSHNLENLIYLPLSTHINNIGWFFISVGVMAVVYAAAYFIIVRRVVRRGGINIGSRGVYVMALSTMIFCFMIQFLFQIYEIDSMWITRLPLVLCCILGITLQFGILTYKKKEEENYLLESYLAQGNSLYETMKMSVDVINMKAHDLKHFVNLVKSGDDPSADEIAAAVEKYEMTANTGNKVLDVILSEKMYLCYKYKIHFTYIVDGSELHFMHTSDLASVFGNALSNAIEYEQKVEESKRSVFLKVFRKNNLVFIHVENYCPEEIAFGNGLPETTKTDRENHGFGLKSMRFTAERYKGSVAVGKSGDLFTVDMVFPVSSDAEKR